MYVKDKSNKRQNYKMTDLTKREIQGLLKIFNGINIFNFENENPIWTELIYVVDIKQTRKFLNAKKNVYRFFF